MSSFRTRFERSLTSQNLAYSTVLLIDASNINSELQYDPDVCQER